MWTLKDGSHLLEKEKTIIVKNFISSIIFRAFTHQKLLINTDKRENKDELCSEATTRLSDTLNRSSEISIIDVFLNCIKEIATLRLRYIIRVIISNLGVNSDPNKFDQLREIETELNDTFVTPQFLVSSFLGLIDYTKLEIAV